METSPVESAAEYAAPIESRREELRQKHSAKLNHWEFLELPFTEKEAADRQEIIALNPKKVKVLCNAGVNRSAFVANILNQSGFEADNAGVTGAQPFTHEDFANEYDAIVFMTEAVREDFYARAANLGMTEKVAKIPSRVLNFPETSVFYESTAMKKAQLNELEPKIQKALDRLGFIKKQIS